MLLLWGEEVSAEAACRQFVREYSTPATRHALVLAEAGKVSWLDVAHQFARTLETAMEEVGVGR